VSHRFDDFMNKQITQDLYGGLVTGVRGYFGDSDWQWDASLNNQINVEMRNDENLGFFPGTRAALTSGAYNPFDPTQRDTTGLGIDTFNRNRFMLNWAEFKANGGLGRFLGFDWAAAAGTSVAHFQYMDRRADAIVNGLTMGQSGVIGSAGRELYALFGEVSGVIDNKFELQASLRGDVYSDFGETINPKVAARYQPTHWLTFRTSAGTGFQAPTLQQMNTSLEGFFPPQTDYVRCADSGDCDGKTFAATQNKNQDLQEETSLSLNFGTIVQPTRDFTLSLDVWMAKVEGTIGTNIDQILRTEADFGPAALADLGVVIERLGGSPTGEIQRVSYTLINQGVQQVEGMDFEGQYILRTSIGDFTFRNELSYLFNYYQEFIERYGRENLLGRAGFPRWRNNLSVGYKSGNFDSLILARSTADMLWDQFAINQFNESIPSPTQFDISVGYNFGDIGKFQIGAINIGNIRPRFSASQDIDRSLFRPFTTYYLTYRLDL
jgi:iron complex outermembrane receptor protein